MASDFGIKVVSLEDDDELQERHAALRVCAVSAFQQARRKWLVFERFSSFKHGLNDSQPIVGDICSFTAGVVCDTFIFFREITISCAMPPFSNSVSETVTASSAVER